MDVDLNECPQICFNAHLLVFNSAVATYYAPSDLSGIGGMHREQIQAVSS